MLSFSLLIKQIWPYSILKQQQLASIIFVCPSEGLKGLVKLKGNLQSHSPVTSLITFNLKFKPFIFLNKKSTKITNVVHQTINTYSKIHSTAIRLTMRREKKALANQDLEKNPLLAVILRTLSLMKQSKPQMPRGRQEQVELFTRINISELRKHRKVNKKVQKSNQLYQQLNNLGLNTFALQFVIGKGGFGKVWKVIEKSSDRIYAMKQMKKAEIIQKRSVESVMNEKELLVMLRHPFLVNINYSFQDRQYLYLVTDYCNRGDLRYHLSISKVFTQEKGCFFLACIILCLQYLHSRGVIHRDLKPQNMVLDKNGYVKLTDLGVSSIVTLRNFQDTSGTPSYMAPQVIFKTNHSFGVDFYALGVIAFQFMTGKRPYLGANRQQIKQRILSHQVQIGNDQPLGWSKNAIDFTNRLIQRKPEARLGFNGMAQVKNHPFFNRINWKLLQQKKLLSPFIPKAIDQDYSNYKRRISDDTGIRDAEEEALISHFEDCMELFKGYQYDRRMEKLHRTIGQPSRKRHFSKN